MDDYQNLAATIGEHSRNRRPLRIVGSGSKRFCIGGAKDGESGDEISTTALTGIVEYEASELYLSARAGTPLTEINAALVKQRQMTAFEPPQFGGGGTLGGAIAAGLSGPGRIRHGALRDHLLGVTIINGNGELLKFGGRVIKNVAGYDISRLCAGAWGTLGLIVEATIKVQPLPAAEITRRLELSPAAALIFINAQLRQGMPISAGFYDGKCLHLRVSSSADDLSWAEKAEKTLGGDAGNNALWANVRDHRHPFFTQSNVGVSLWRLSVPATADCAVADESVFEWHGALHWLQSDRPAAEIRKAAAKIGGQAWRFKTAAECNDNAAVFHPLPDNLMNLHRRLKHAFDPAGILNPGIMGL